MSDPEDTAEMLVEMGEIGVPMLLIILAIWAIMVFIANRVSIEMPTTETA
jgi:flagellar biogenesis protein FliO